MLTALGNASANFSTVIDGQREKLGAALDAALGQVSARVSENLGELTSLCESYRAASITSYVAVETQILAKCAPEIAKLANTWRDKANEFIESTTAYKTEALAQHAQKKATIRAQLQGVVSNTVEELRRSRLRNAIGRGAATFGKGLLFVGELIIVVAAGIIVVGLAASVGAALAAAAAVVGAFMLGYTFGEALVRRYKQLWNNDWPWLAKAFGAIAVIGVAVGDTLGLSQIAEGIRGTELISEKALSDEERAERATEGGLQLITLGLMHAIGKMTGKPVGSVDGEGRAKGPVEGVEQSRGSPENAPEPPGAESRKKAVERSEQTSADRTQKAIDESSAQTEGPKTAQAAQASSKPEGPKGDAPKPDAPKSAAPKPAASKGGGAKTEAPKSSPRKAAAAKTAAAKADAPKADALEVDQAKPDVSNSAGPEADAPKPDVPKTETAGTEPPKADSANAEPPKLDASKADAPKADASKADASKADASKAAPSKADASKADASKAAPSKADAPKADESKTDGSKADASKADASKGDAPEADASNPEASKADPSKADAPKTDSPKPTNSDAPQGDVKGSDGNEPTRESRASQKTEQQGMAERIRANRAPETEAQRTERLSHDPKRGKVDRTSRNEAKVGLDLEQSGRLKPPVDRPIDGLETGDLVDGNGKSWDVKSPRSRDTIMKQMETDALEKGRKPKKLDPNKKFDGEFDVDAELAKIEKSLSTGESVILDLKGLNSQDAAVMREAVKAYGEDQVLIYE